MSKSKATVGVWLLEKFCLHSWFKKKTKQKNNSLDMSYLASFNNESAKQILMDIIRTVNQPENSKKLSEAKASAGKEMILMMQHVFPLVMQLQLEVIKVHGFPGNREGLVQFSQLIREMERDDMEIARLRSQIRAIYLPPIAINTTNDILI